MSSRHHFLNFSMPVVSRPTYLIKPRGLLSTLDVTEGMAGQTITLTAVVAIFSGLFATSITRGVDRRFVVIGYVLLMLASCLLAAMSSGFALVMAGRALLGLALGGFWGMSASLMIRLAKPDDVPKALSIMFGGVSVALVFAAPLGSYLGELIGWRGLFYIAAAFSGICLIWQYFAMPSLPSTANSNIGHVLGVLKRPHVPAAMGAIFCIFAGEFALFTYMRPFLEQVGKFGIDGISEVFLLFGIANFIGNALFTRAAKRGLRNVLLYAPAIIMLCAVSLMFVGTHHYLTAAIVALWGAHFGFVPVGWSTWITRNLNDDAENAGLLQVAIIQCANALGAGIGGIAFDTYGNYGPMVIAVLLFGFTVLLVATKLPANTGSA